MEFGRDTILSNGLEAPYEDDPAVNKNRRKRNNEMGDE